MSPVSAVSGGGVPEGEGRGRGAPHLSAAHLPGQAGSRGAADAGGKVGVMCVTPRPRRRLGGPAC